MPQPASSRLCYLGDPMQMLQLTQPPASPVTWAKHPPAEFAGDRVGHSWVPEVSASVSSRVNSQNPEEVARAHSPHSADEGTEAGRSELAAKSASPVLILCSSGFPTSQVSKVPSHFKVFNLSMSFYGELGFMPREILMPGPSGEEGVGLGWLRAGVGPPCWDPPSACRGPRVPLV